MKKDKTFFLNTVLAAVWFAVLLAAVLVRVFAPMVMSPAAKIPDLVLVSLVVLLADHYLAPGAKRSYPWIFGLAVLTFGLLPLAAGMGDVGESCKLGLTGGVVFTAVTWLFSSMQERIRSGEGTRITPIVCALGLYLAAQCFAGMIL